MAQDSVEKIGLGGGCHWCTEAVFSSLRGVTQVEQGWIAAEATDDSFSEAVLVGFNPAEIGLERLIEVHLHTHASTSNHALRGKYRSAVYVFSEPQREKARAAITKLQNGFEKQLVTRILPFQTFKASDERFRYYYAKDPSRPFCQAYIDPKLAFLKKQYGELLGSIAPRT